MSMKNVVVEGCSLEFQNGGGPNSAIIIDPNQVSTKNKAEGKGVYKTLTFKIQGYSGQAIDVSGSGTGDGQITVTAQHTKVEGNLVLLEGDVSPEIKITGQKTTSSGTTTAYAFEIVKVTKAGQSKVKGS